MGGEWVYPYARLLYSIRRIVRRSFWPKKDFFIGISIFILASFFSGISSNVLILIISRFIQGLGGALMIPGSLSILSSSFEGESRGRAIGIWSAAGALLFILGPPLGGFFAGLGWWRLIFFINLPLGLLTLFLVQTQVPESKDSSIEGSLDITGIALISLSLAILTYSFTNWPGKKGESIFLIGLILLGILFFLLFLLVEFRSKSPIVPLFLFKSTWFSGSNLLTFFLYGALGVFSFFFPVNLIRVQGYSFSQTGLSYLAFPLPLIVLSGYMGGLSGKYGPRWFLIIGPILASIAFFWLGQIGQTQGPSEYFQTYFPALLLLGFSMSLVVAPLTHTVMSSLPNHYSGTASGINNAVTRMAFLLVVALVGSASIHFFTLHFNQNIENMELGKNALDLLRNTSNRMMETEMPSHLNPAKGLQIHSLLKSLFLQLIQYQMEFSAILALSSAFIASLWIGDPKSNTVRK